MDPSFIVVFAWGACGRPLKSVNGENQISLEISILSTLVCKINWLTFKKALTIRDSRNSASATILCFALSEQSTEKSKVEIFPWPLQHSQIFSLARRFALYPNLDRERASRMEQNPIRSLESARVRAWRRRRRSIPSGSPIYLPGRSAVACTSAAEFCSREALEEKRRALRVHGMLDDVVDDLIRHIVALFDRRGRVPRELVCLRIADSSRFRRRPDR